jgi:hypothetical protein
VESVSLDEVTKTVALAPFPATAVETRLREELLHSVESIAAIHGVAMPAGMAQQSSMSIQIDSLVVVELLCGVETLLGGATLKDHVVKAGGYGSINEAVGHLMPRIEKEWTKHQNKAGKK